MNRNADRRLWQAAVGLAALLSVTGAGCGGIEKQDSFTLPNPMIVRPERPLADVPVPVGFAFKSNGSYIFSGNYRVAKLLYRGTPHIDACMEYFKREMPQSRWNFVRDSGVDGRAMTFYNECEELNIKFDRVAGLTSLDIEIKPRRV
jgi:hypothetical protein